MSSPIAPSATGSLALAAAASQPAAVAPAKNAQITKVAKQFEAIFIRQMLAESRKTTFDKDGLFSGQGSETFQQMQDERFADIAANKGTFGLAKMIEKQLLARPNAVPTASAATGSAAVSATGAATGATGG